jgi:hypothetical protein
VLENAMSVIFFHRVAIRRRHFLVSAIMPYPEIAAHLNITGSYEFKLVYLRVIASIRGRLSHRSS